MSLFYDQPSLFDGPPAIPDEIRGALRYEALSNAYYKRLKNVVFIVLEVIAASLVLGIIWINVDWVKIIVTVIAITISLVLLILLNYILW